METYFITLLALSSLVVVWFLAYLVHRLVHSVADGSSEGELVAPADRTVAR